MKRWIIPLVAAIVLTGGVFTYIVAKAALSTPETPVATKPEPEKPPTAKELLRLVNIERKKVGVAPLKIDANMAKTAQIKAEDMKARNYFAHNVPGANSMFTNEMMPFLEKSGCPGVSENIFWADQDKTQTAVDWWNNSKPHYEAMVNPDYTKVGFGIKDWRVVAHFCIAK